MHYSIIGTTVEGADFSVGVKMGSFGERVPAVGEFIIFTDGSHWRVESVAWRLLTHHEADGRTTHRHIDVQVEVTPVPTKVPRTIPSKN